MKSQNSIYEQALLNLCKKAGVKSPLDLIDKKIAFIFDADSLEIKMFAKISRVVILNDKDGGFVSLFLSSGEDYHQELCVLNCYDGEAWKCCYFNKGKTDRIYLIKSMIFRLKWWQI